MKITAKQLQQDIRDAMFGGEGKVKIEHVLKDSLPTNCRLFAYITLEPGCSIGQHTHSNETEFFIVLEGTATANDDGEIIDISKGDVIMTPHSEGHSIENIGKDDFKMLAIIILD